MEVLLLVEPNKVLRMSLLDALGQRPYKILTARTEEEAKKIIKTSTLSVLVSDCSSPGVNGVALLAFFMEENRPLPGKAILMVDDPKSQAGREARIYSQLIGSPIRGVLAKPFAIAKFLELLDT